MSKSRPYFTLVAHEGDHIADNPWGVAFGDYDRATVESEFEDYRDNGWKRSELKIIRTQSDTQAAIDAAVALLNAKEA